MAYMHQIRPGLYLGELTSLRHVQKFGITHILSVTKEAPAISDMYPEGDHKQLIIKADDVETEDLVRYFQQSIDFIKGGLKDGGHVLVHCIAGMSRSPTVVMAYLMQTEEMDASTARASVHSLRHVVSPNDGFIKQLDVWQDMGSHFDENHPYAKWNDHRDFMNFLQERRTAGDAIDKEDLAEPKVESSTSQDLLYRCRKCRMLIATSKNEAPYYVVKQGDESAPKFRYKRINSKKKSGSTNGEATQLFVEPMQWMEEVLDGAVQGKLYCKGCQARVGNFNWSGMQNSKGDWVTPAFELQLNRLDALPSAQSGPNQIRKPLL